MLDPALMCRIEGMAGGISSQNSQKPGEGAHGNGQETSSMAKAIHSMIRVLDENRSVDFYRSAFGLTNMERIDFEAFTLVYLSNEETAFELELTINKGQGKPYDIGDGYGHLAFSVDDLEVEHKRLGALGLSPRDIVDFQHEGRSLARFFFVTDPDGYQIEVLQRGGRYR